jgi:hypothetical protein
MAKGPTLEQQLASLAELDDGELADAAVLRLRGVLGSRSHVLVARGARIAGRRGIEGLVPELGAAFSRFMKDPERTDKGCRAKTAIVEALNRLDAQAAAVFLLGIGHVQMEPVWGGRVDTAAELRALSGLGLARLQHPEARLRLTDLLADPEALARVGAARALSALGGESAELLLRLKIHHGDSDSEVLAECFTALLAIAAERAVPLVARRLEHEDADVVMAAALALGESGREDAVRLLLAHWDAHIRAEDREPLLLPLALSRQPAALEHLLGVLAHGPGRLAGVAIEAMRIYRSDRALVQRLRQVLRERGDAGLRQVFEREFEA